jgi:diguanylate cyclase (GGDEF)-like protein
MANRPILYTFALSVVVILLAVALAASGYQFVGQYSPGMAYQVICTIVIASILAPIFLYPLITTASKLRTATSELKRKSATDALTGLPNSVALTDELTRSLASAREQPLAVHFVDLDRFKEVNDTMGHPCGDKLLVAVARRLLDLVDGHGFVARFGGDEFVVIQWALGSLEEAAGFATRIVATLSQAYDIDGKETRVGATVGIAVAPIDGTEISRLLRAADVALYRAKATAKGSTMFFDSAMDAEAQSRRRLEADLARALREGEFELHFQPLFQRGTLRVTTCEALLRWNHPQRGTILPDRFIPLAESTGMIGEIGGWVLREACLECARWPANIRVAVNLSPVQFQHGDVVGTVRAALERSGIAANRLEVEITESVLLHDSAATRDALDALREMGVRISLDDFGTGYSGLNYLHNFGLDKVKIDRLYVTGLGSSERSRTLLLGAARLSAELGLAVAVEGIETEEQAEIIAAEPSIDELQGYLFSPPLPIGRLRELLTATMPALIAAERRDAPASRKSASV